MCVLCCSPSLFAGSAQDPHSRLQRGATWLGSGFISPDAVSAIRCKAISCCVAAPLCHNALVRSALPQGPEGAPTDGGSAPPPVDGHDDSPGGGGAESADDDSSDMDALDDLMR